MMIHVLIVIVSHICDIQTLKKYTSLGFKLIVIIRYNGVYSVKKAKASTL